MVSVVLLYACQKELSQDGAAPGQQKISLFLTDDPGIFDSVVVDIRSVKVKVDTCSQSTDDDDEKDDDGHDDDDDDSCEVWHNLQVNPGKYDLLSLRNGVDTLLATGNVPAGDVEKVIIELGTGHYLVKDSIRYPLNLMPGRKPFITVKLKDEHWDQVSIRNSRIWLDFDVARSIVQGRNNQFYLLPVIRPFSVKKTASLEGTVLPREAAAVVSLFNATDTAFALPERDGEFKIRGLKPGSYTLFVNAGNGYRDTTINNIVLESGKEREIPTIRLRK